ncbi:solute carrier family 22 member 6-like [Drosophila busckii]|uniref:solute carrier family 22 member 6-like n=1 Tax=Drosophila busckii TaxID=30019 RepID=UPI00083ED227|nr:solute carrier family 22 member 6-like [Drosophila busckii]
MDFDRALAKCGNNHRYQYLLLSLYSLLIGISPYHHFSQNIINFVPEHYCYHEQLVNQSFAQLKALYSQFEKPSCTRLDSIDAAGNVTLSAERCDRWFYNYDNGFRSMSAELNWVCESNYKTPMGHSFNFLGSVFGTLIFGWLGDRIGRIWPLIGANLCAFVGDLAAVFTTNITSFSITRFIAGLAMDGDTCLMYILEYVSLDLRITSLNLIRNTSYAFGMIITSLTAISVGNWKLYLICASMPKLLIISYNWLIQESAQWLITRNDIEGAIKRLRKIAKFNKRAVKEEHFEDFRSYCQTRAAKHAEEHQNKFTDIFKTPHLRNTVLRLLLIFTIMLFCRHILSRSVQVVGISPYISFALSASVLPVAGLVQMKLQKNFGRKTTSTSAMLLTGLMVAASGITLSLSKEPSVYLLVALMMLSRFGISVCFGATLLYTSELVPTCVRSRILGAGYISGSIVSILVPYILHLRTYNPAAPSIILCLFFFSSAYTCLHLPETHNRKLPNTLAEGEQFGKHERMFDFLRRAKPVDEDEEIPSAETREHLMPEQIVNS